MVKRAVSFSRVVLWLVFLLGGAAAQGAYAVQLEATPTLAAAQQRVSQLRARNVQAYLVKSDIPGKGTFYRVRVGRFATQAEARRAGQELQRQGVTADFYVASYEKPLDEPLPAPAQTPPPAAPAVERKEPPPESPKSTPVATPNANGAGFLRYTDPAAGYSFEYPQYWEGGSLDRKDAQPAGNQGAIFKSSRDAAFLNAIWNRLEKANSPENDNDLIVELILRSMSSGEGTQQMKESSRRVVTENGLVKTYLDLTAKFAAPGSNAPLDFLGKAVIVRAPKGILLVVTFYSKSSPSNLPQLADRILASVQAP